MPAPTGETAAPRRCRAQSCASASHPPSCWCRSRIAATYAGGWLLSVVCDARRRRHRLGVDRRSSRGDAPIRASSAGGRGAPRRRGPRRSRCGRGRSSRSARLAPARFAGSRRSRSPGRAPVWAAAACSMPASGLLGPRCCAKIPHWAGGDLFFCSQWCGSTDILGLFRRPRGRRAAARGRASARKRRGRARSAAWSARLSPALVAFASGVGLRRRGAGALALVLSLVVARRRSCSSPRSSGASASRTQVTSFPAMAG